MRRRGVLVVLGVWLIGASAYAQQPSSAGGIVMEQGPDARGAIRGTVTDADGALVPGATVMLTPCPVKRCSAVTAADGSFSFVNLPPQAYRLTVESGATVQGLASGSYTAGELRPGQVMDLPAIVLHSAEAATEVNVTPLTQHELAEQDVHAEEQQRVFHIIPNFFVTYKKNPPPLDAREKFELALHGTYDPASFISSAFVAGIEQANNTLPGYHQGVEGYAKRFGATYVNFASATLLRDAFFPAILHQDPRYHFRGTGSKASRALYALSTAVICYGDNGRRQLNYSSLLGNLSAGALTNVYYPAGSRNGLSTTLEDGFLATAGVGVGHLIQEFVFVRVTSRAKRAGTYQP